MPEVPVAGRLRHFARAWSEMTSDPWILAAVRGLRLDLTDSPWQEVEPRELALTADRVAAVEAEVDELLQKGAIIAVSESSLQFVSQIFTIPKKDSAQERPVINLKALNAFIQYEHFQMEGLKLLPDLLQQHDWMVKLDLKDAYFVVPMAAEHRKFLRFRWSGRLFEFQCLPFGLSSAPRVFTKLMKVPIAILRSQGIRLVIYLDDLLIMAESASIARQQVEDTIQLLHRLGFLINFKKSVLSPTQAIAFLGFQVDSRAMEMRVPTEKIKKLRHECSSTLGQPEVSVRALACLLGRMTSVSPGLLTAPLRYRHLQQLKTSALHQSGSYDGKVRLTSGAVTDLQWWVQKLTMWNGKSLVRPHCNLVVYSDASLDGWGAVCREVQVGGQWSQEEKQLHINALELKAAMFALQAFQSVVPERPLHVRMFVDNTTCQAYVNKMGGTHSDLLTAMACDLWEWCLDRQITVQADYIPSAENPADAPSRGVTDASDWMLDPSIFAALCRHFHIHPDVDLFASRLNSQLPQFVSWGPQPGAMEVDALAINWTALCLYAFPPFALLSRVLSKLSQSPGCLILLIAPVWDAQPWYPLLLRLLVAQPVLLPGRPDLLSSPSGHSHPMIRSGHMQLAGWLISPDPLRQRAFRRRLSSSCSLPGGPPPMPPIRRRGQFGKAGVISGASVRFDHLSPGFCSS